MRRLTLTFAIAFGALAVGCGQGSSGGADDATADASADGRVAVTAAEAAGVRTGVAGVARDARTGAALQGVTISDGSRSVSTGEGGRYVLAEAAGSYTLTASKSGYQGATQRIKVTRNRITTINWSLTASAPVACVYGYGAWGTCQAGGTQTRVVTSTSPSGCTGTPVTTQACQPSGGGGTPTGAAFKVFANNDLGMHCVDKSFAVFSILPPYNVVDAQVVALQSSGLPVVLSATDVRVGYSAVADAAGSINSTSIGKTDFWQYAAQLYGASLAPGEGLEGLWMPKDAPSASATTLGWDSAMGLFKAPGIPIFPVDDAGAVNRYPLMRFTAYAGSGAALASTDVVLPVSEETSCQTCHATGKVAAPTGARAWATDTDLEAQARRNVLILHNARNGTALQAPVLCATCHYSPALDLKGAGPSGAQTAHRSMSSVMHAYHAGKMAGLVDAPVAVGGAVPAAATQACYQCHPGTSTQCLRGAMTQAVDCQNCHGNMAAVGGLTVLRPGGSIDGTNDGKARRPWLDLPRCQSCHASDAVARTSLSGAPRWPPTACAS